MWSTRKELETVLAHAGLGEWSPRLAAAARPAMILEPGPLEEGADAPIGASRLGGMPDLPPDVPWPWRPAISGRKFFADHAERPWPLTFAAQIDFGEIHSAGGLEGFPSSGRLLFFCDPILEPWGWSSDDKSCASVMRRTVSPGAPSPSNNSCELLTLDGLPPPGWRLIYPKRWEGNIAEAYHQFWQALDKEHPNACGYHQVGGIAFPETAPVEAECIKYGDDDYSNNPPEEEKAFRERREKDGAPIDGPDYEEWSPTRSLTGSAQATWSAPATGNSCCNSPGTTRSGRGGKATPMSASGRPTSRNAGSIAAGRCGSAVRCSAPGLGPSR